MKKLRHIVLISTLFLFCLPVVAETALNEPVSIALPKSSEKLDTENLQKMLTNKLGIDIHNVTATPMAGVIEIITSQGVFYTDKNGEFFIQGQLIGLSGAPINYTEKTLAMLRLAGMKTFENDMIVYKAENEKHVITVFTDITCGYCQKMHEQIADYNKLGITVRYLAYPRHGITDSLGNYTQNFQDLRSVWCNEDSKKALTKAKETARREQHLSPQDKSSVPLRICDKPIEAEFAFGIQIGVNGTPAIILSDGSMLPGYRPPEAMLNALYKASLGN